MGASSGAVQVWDMRSQKVAVTLAEHAGAVRGLAFSENGYYMASGAKDEVVKVWDLRNGSCLQNLAMGSAVNAVCFDYSGTYLCGAGEALKVWSTKTWEETFEHAEAVKGYHAAVFGAKAEYLLAGCGNRAVVKLGLWRVCCDLCALNKFHPFLSTHFGTQFSILRWPTLISNRMFPF